MDIEVVLKQVNVDCKDNGHEFFVTSRLQAIAQLLSKSEYKLLYSGRLCQIYGKQPIKGKSVILISSHVDCVYDRLFYEETANGRCLKGTFDNSITNACVLMNMIRDEFDDNVIIAFTGDEEENSGGAYEVVKILRRWNCHIVIAIVLDVTEEGWKEQYNFTIENDLGIDIFTGYRIINTLENNKCKFGFIHDSEPDESYDYDEEEIPSLSLCIPSFGNMHSEKGILVRREDILSYSNVISLLANMLIATPQIMEKEYYIEYEDKGNHIMLRSIHNDEEDCNDNYEYIQVKEKNGALVLPSLIHGLPVTEIEDFYMMGSKNDNTIQELVIPASFQKLGKKNFSRWKRLEKIVLYCQDLALCEWNFAYCNNLKTVVCKNNSIYNLCQKLSFNTLRPAFGCFDGCLSNINFVVEY